MTRPAADRPIQLTRYLVTGGAGFIGSHIVERLVRQGEYVRVLDNLSTGFERNLSRHGNQVDFLRGDLCDPATVRQAVDGIDVVFHQAALASVPASLANPARTHEVCTTGTVHLLDACRDLGVRRVVFAGSSSCYGDLPESPKRESSPLMPLSPYAAAKLAAEMYMEAYARSYRLETVRLRYFNVFGPRQDPKGPYAAVIPLFVAALLEGRRPVIYGDGNQSRDFVFVENVVNANFLAATVEGVSGNVYNVASGQSLTVNELLTAICGILGTDFDPEYRPARTGDILHSGADISAARRDLGYDCVCDWQAGLEQTVRWYAEEHRRQRSQTPVPTPAASR